MPDPARPRPTLIVALVVTVGLVTAGLPAAADPVPVRRDAEPTPQDLLRMVAARRVLPDPAVHGDLYEGAPAAAETGPDPAHEVMETLACRTSDCGDWAHRFDGTRDATDLGLDVAAGHDGDVVYVSGGTDLSLFGGAYGVVALDTATGDPIWVARHQGPGAGGLAMDVAAGPDGDRVYATGFTVGDGTSWDYDTVALDAATGETLWTVRYDGPEDDTENFEDVDIANAVAIAPDGGSVFVTGTSAGQGLDYATVAYDAATGQQRWVARHHHDHGGKWFGKVRVSGDQARMIDVAPDGDRVVVSGFSPDPDTGFDHATVAYDAAEGAEHWVARYDGDGAEDWANALTFAPDGGLYVTGHSLASASGYDFATQRLDPADGSADWTARFDGADGLDDEAWGLDARDGRVVAAGMSVSDRGGADVGVVAYDAATGGETWRARHSGPGHGFDMAWSVRSTGRTVVVAGETERPAARNRPLDVTAIALDAADGQTQWTARYDGPGQGVDRAFEVALHPDGSQAYVAGYSRGPNLCTRHAVGPHWAEACASREDDRLCIVAQGDLFFGGQCVGLDCLDGTCVEDTAFDYVTLAFDVRDGPGGPALPSHDAVSGGRGTETL